VKVLVTGGAGFIGSNLVYKLVAEGHDVTVIDNLLSGYRCNLDPVPEVKFVEGDIRDNDALAEAVPGAEVIFHLAASVGNKRSIDLPHDDAEINLIGTIRLLEMARKHNVRKIVVSSSAGIFGELKTLPIKEDHPIAPISPYGVSKLAQEKVALAYMSMYGMEVACLRYFNIFGPNQRFDEYGNVIPKFVFKMLAGEQLTIFGDGEQTRDFLYVDDVAKANMQAAFTEGACGAFNLGMGSAITVNHLIKLIEKTSGIKPDVVLGPERLGDVRDSLADITLAKEAFGFSPSTDFELNLKTYVEWAKLEHEKA
jgi:nucleoside-diphosphate-sugar epimerase